MHYSLRQLEVFVATARHANISQAAASLAMSQSAASGALKELEQQFSMQLFDRVGKRLQLSELGRQLRPAAEALLAQAQAFEQALAGADQGGSLRLGATMTIGNYLAVPMIAQFKQAHPDTDISLHVANTEHIAQQVLGFELDLGMIEGEYHHSKLLSHPWRRDTLQVFAAPDHPLAAARRVNDQQLIAQPWILREPGSGTRQAFERAMHGLLHRLDITLELQHTEAIKRAVEAGLGIGCLSAITLQEAFARGSLVPLAVPQRNFNRQLYLISHKHKYHSPALERWLAQCLQTDG